MRWLMRWRLQLGPVLVSVHPLLSVCLIWKYFTSCSQLYVLSSVQHKHSSFGKKISAFVAPTGTKKRTTPLCSTLGSPTMFTLCFSCQLRQTMQFCLMKKWAKGQVTPSKNQIKKHFSNFDNVATSYVHFSLGNSLYQDV